MSEPTSSSPIPPAVRAAFAKVQARLAALSKLARVGLAVGIVTLGTIAVLVATRLGRETYAPLFTQLDRDDAAALVAKLKEMKVPYHLVGDGTGVEVPEARVHELRLELAAAGLPRGGGVGFESFDKMKLGATEFEQRVLYRRALEGELGRTVGSLAAVQSARVHLVLPERSVFVSKNEPASASVVVKLRPGRALSASEIAGVVHLCASAVPGLTADRVALVTTEGMMLHRPRPEGGEPGGLGGGDTDQLTAARALEASLEDRARVMLEKLVGPGHVDVRISAELDLARLERIADQFDPTKTALRSETKTIEQNGGVVDTVAGIPGAESNLPTGAGSASVTPAGSGVARLSHTRNWEVSRITEKRIVTGGVLKRLTVAVVVDGVKQGQAAIARSPEELAKITALVKGAVGLDEKRGDVLSVESVPFLSTETDPAAAAAAMPTPKTEAFLAWFKKLPKKAQLGIGGGVLVALLLGGFFVIRTVRKAFRRTSALAVVDGRAAGPLDAEEQAAGPAKKTVVEVVDYRSAAMDRAARDPATAALVLRAWLGTLEQKGATGLTAPAPVP